MSFIWIVEEDFEKQIKDEVLRKITNNDISILYEAERDAISEVQGYLRSKYDLDTIFNTIGENRNRTILSITIDIILYRIHTRLNPSQVPQIRQNLYDEAKRMMDDIVKGKLDFDLPRLVSEDGETKSKFQWDSDRRRSY